MLPKEDVYIVNTYQLLEWIKNPVSADDAKTYKPWMTQCDVIPRNCSHPTECLYKKLSRMEVCGGDCPKSYPWLGNPLGDT